MAAIIGRSSRQALLRAKAGISAQNASFGSFRNLSKGKKAALMLTGALTTGGIGAAVVLDQCSVSANDLILHPPKLPWSHNGPTQSLDAASVRRGYFVYKQVCAACHSLNYICIRNLVGVIMSEEEGKIEAATYIIKDGPDESGNMFERPGKLTDGFPVPYENDEAARAANNGALPPDLSFVTLARHGEEDYIFSLLTGYNDPPAGVEVSEGQHYNPYFTGGAISMAQALYNEIIEYEDGTPATQSQLAKDVCTFLKWTAEPFHDDRKKMSIKAGVVVTALFFLSYYLKRHKWSVLHSQKQFFKKL